MKVIDPGHRYFLDGLKSSEGQYLQFYKDAEINGDGYSGCSSQEVLRSLIDRVKFLETQKSAPENEEIVLHLREALRNFEMRALRLDVEAGVAIEELSVGPLGHWYK